MDLMNTQNYPFDWKHLKEKFNNNCPSSTGGTVLKLYLSSVIVQLIKNIVYSVNSNFEYKPVPLDNLKIFIIF